MPVKMRKIIQNESRKNISALIAAILIFLFVCPYFMWNLHNTTPLYSLLSIILLLVFSMNSDVKTKKRGELFVFFSFLLILSTLYNDLNLFGMIATLCCLFVPFAKKDFAKQSFDYFLTIYSVIIGMSSVIWILHLIGIVQPMDIINPLNQLKDYNYYVYPLLVSPIRYLDFERFCGPFDEPGVIGTISALILTIGKFNLKDKRLLIVFITGFFTMSFFYYVIVAFYYSIYNFTVSKNKKLGVFILLLLASLVFISLSNELLNERLWSRFLWDDERESFVGNNRFSDSTRRLLNSISETTFLFGMGKTTEFLNATKGLASLFNVVALYGLLFVSFYIYIFAKYGWIYKKNIVTYFLFLFVFIACIYQRPFLFQPEYLFLFSLMAMSCGDLLENKKALELRRLFNNKQLK